MKHYFPSLAALLFFLCGSVAAQQMPEQQMEEQEQEAEQERTFGELSQEDVDAFIEAYPKVRELEQGFIQRLRDRDDDVDASTLQREHAEERLELIEEAGLDSERYRQILGGMARSDELRDYIESRLPANGG